MSFVYLNGTVTQSTEALISPYDLGLLRGYGVFEYLRTFKGQPLYLKAHLERLKQSGAALHLTLPKSLQEIEETCHSLLHQSPPGEHTLRLILTGGVSLDGITPGQQNSLYILINPLSTAPLSLYEEGLSAITLHMTRFMPQVKSLHYLPAILALEQAKRAGAQEAIYLSSKNELLEATTSNLLAFKGNTLIAPHGPEILQGITREIVLQLASEHFTIEERPLSFNELPEIHEIVLTSSIRGIISLVKLDGQPIGEGKPGPRSEWLRAQYETYCDSLIWTGL